MSWFGNLFKKSADSGNQSSGVNPLPGLPTSTIGAVAGAVIETERTVEQQVALRNTPAMQQGKVNQQEQAMKDKINEAISKDDIDTERKLWS